MQQLLKKSSNYNPKCLISSFIPLNRKEKVSSTPHHTPDPTTGSSHPSPYAHSATATHSLGYTTPSSFQLPGGYSIHDHDHGPPSLPHKASPAHNLLHSYAHSYTDPARRRRCLAPCAAAVVGAHVAPHTLHVPLRISPSRTLGSAERVDSRVPQRRHYFSAVLDSSSQQEAEEQDRIDSAVVDSVAVLLVLHLFDA